MAGRCGCSSSAATGASLSAGACTTVTGAGTPASPAIIGVLIDDDPSNNLQCSPSGLFSATAQVEAGDCATVVGDGSLATPYVVSAKVDPAATNNLDCGGDGLFVPKPQLEAADASVVVTGDGTVATPHEVAAQVSVMAGNLLQLEADGLYGKANPAVLQGTSTLFGGALPADPHWAIESGTHVGNSDVNGHVTVPIFVDLDGILSILFSVGDRPISHTEANLDMGSVGLSGFDIVFEDAGAYGTPIVAGTFRINYTVIGWYTP